MCSTSNKNSSVIPGRKNNNSQSQLRRPEIRFLFLRAQAFLFFLSSLFFFRKNQTTKEANEILKSSTQLPILRPPFKRYLSTLVFSFHPSNRATSKDHCFKLRHNDYLPPFTSIHRASHTLHFSPTYSPCALLPDPIHSLPMPQSQYSLPLSHPVQLPYNILTLHQPKASFIKKMNLTFIPLATRPQQSPTVPLPLRPTQADSTPFIFINKCIMNSSFLIEN